MTTYPDAFDSDLELPRLNDNLSELSAEYINSLRDSVIALQEALGLNPQGQKSSLTNRVNVSIDSNGYIKKSALSGIGLVTLPITNTHIGVTAGIQESKLALDYNTATLKTMIDSLRTDFDGVVSGLSLNTDAINRHFLGLGNYHDGYHIKINTGASIGIAGLEATTIGDAINEIDSRLFSGNDSIEPHIDLNVPSTIKHPAEKISVDASGFTTIDRTVLTAQEAFDSMDVNSGALGVEHLDIFHSNGILKEIKSGSYYNSNYVLLDTSSGAYYDEGFGIVTIPGITSFSSLGVRAGDILKIHEKSGIQDAGSYQITAIGPLEDADTLGGIATLDSDQIMVFHTFAESRAQEDNISVSIYKPSTESSDYAPLACSIRNNETIVDTLSVLPPDAAKVVSIGFNGSVLNSDGYNINVKVGIDSSNFREITIPDLNLVRLGTNHSSPVTSKSVSERINAYLSDPDLGNHFPASAYSVGDELIIAHNWVGSNYWIQIGDGYTGNFALGLDAYGADVTGKTVYGNAYNNYVINGTWSSELNTIFDGYASITSASESFVLWTNDGHMINPKRYGIKSGSVMHVSGHETTDVNGSYTLLSANESTVSVFNAEEIPAPSSPTTFSVKFTSGNVPLTILDNTETTNGIVEAYIIPGGEVFLHQRLVYGTNLGSGIEITDMSSGFPPGDISIIVGLLGDSISFNIVDDTMYGDTVHIHDAFRGLIKLYHPNGIDYLKIKIIEGQISGGIEIATIAEQMSTDEAMLICSAHFNGSLSITNTVDKRTFGNLSATQIGDDFIELFSQRPVKELRSDGVVHGFDILDALYLDSITNMQAIPMRGGIAYVNGARVAVETQKVLIQSYDSEGNIVQSARRIVAINEYGSVQVMSDELGEILIDGYNSSAEFGKMLPLYYVDIVNGGIENVIDVRKFINNVDDKIELIVDETESVIGNFKSLEGAILFADKYPGREKLTIRIINTVHLENPITLPDGVSLIGGASYGGDSKHQIANYSVESHHLITLSGNNRVENIEIISPEVLLQGALLYVDGSNVNIENCLFRFGEEITTFDGNYAVEISRNSARNVRIFNNIIDNVYSGIFGEYGVDNLLISDNKIYNVSGTGGNAYGIRVGSGARSVGSMIIENNLIDIPSIVSGTDLRAIEIETGLNIKSVKVVGNSIIHESQNTITNGIRADVFDGYDGVIDNLIISNNIVDGVKLDDNYVFGIYVSNTNKTVISNNILKNIGVYADSRTDTSAIRLATTSGITEIYNNIIQNCSVLRGIEIGTQSQTSRVVIENNTLIGLGTEAQYIRGFTSNSIISGNNLIGPGQIGIRWSGNGTKISNNNMSRPNTIEEGDTESDYAFEQYAIYVPASDVDIENNTITGMIFDQESNGISNAGAGRNRLKIIGNTISGSLMNKIIELYGSGHVINNNKFLNEALPSGQATLCVELNSVTNSMIMGNTFAGAISIAITSSATSTSDLTVANNSVIAETINTTSIKLNGTTDTCFIMGNRFPDGLVEENVVGSDPTYGVYNTNVMGINYGMQDTRGIHASAGVSAFDSSSVPHWAFSDTSSFWELHNTSATNRYLFFPIEGMPNGSKLNSVQVQGRMSSEGTIKIRVYKRSTQASGLQETSLSSEVSISTSGYFGNSTTTGYVEISTSGGEIINYVESNYYVRIEHTGTVTSPETLNIHGVTINFTY